MHNKYTMQDINGGFWCKRMRTVSEQVVPLQLAILEDRVPGTEPSHAIENFKIAAGITKGEYHGMVFQDSDIGKWIEAAAYRLTLEPDADLESKIDEIVGILEKAQQPDGYLNTYYTVKEPGKRWTNLLECHELYCAGHLIEGAVAYYEATGKRRFLDIMCRMADHIDGRIGPEEGKLHGYPGHPEIELALVRLYRSTGEARYLRLAQFFIDERGRQPYFFDEERARRNNEEHFPGLYAQGREYAQWHTPVREQMDATGHAVRALYLYAAMAEVAVETGDQTLKDACQRLWDSAVNRRMYITGSFGATHHGEAFSGDYELPNDTAYAETCANVAFLFFGKGMLGLSRNGAIADEMERALYNGVLSGMQLDGTRFFYVNPLEVVQGVSGKAPEYRHVLPQRQKWFGCACCPPNAARLITSLPEYAYEASEKDLAIHQYLGGTCFLPTAGGVSVTHTSNYPWDGDLLWDIAPVKAGEEFELHIRIPGWCKGARLFVDGTVQPLEGRIHMGYVTLKRKWAAHTSVLLSLPLDARRQYAHPGVRENAGCVAFMRGPLVYCFESEDNGAPLGALRIPRSAQMIVNPYDASLLGGVRTLSIDGLYLAQAGSLYSEIPPKNVPKQLTAIPYFAWANRGAGDMRVWMVEQAGEG